MVYDNMTYKQVETAFYEAMRTIKKKTAEWSKEKEVGSSPKIIL